MKRETLGTLRARIAALGDTWTDEHGTVHERPTAWAYAQACLALDKWRQRAAELEGERLQIQRAICATACGEDGSEDDAAVYTLDEIVGHIAAMDERRSTAVIRAAECQRRAGAAEAALPAPEGFGKSGPLLSDFTEYCRENPSLRFWQALLAWSGFEFLRGEIGEMRQDTFYMEDRGPATLRSRVLPKDDAEGTQAYQEKDCGS